MVALPFRPGTVLRWIALSIIVVCVGVYLTLVGPEVRAAPLCTYGGVVLYENSNQTEDSVKVCSPTLLPYNVSRSNFEFNPASSGLHDGCNAGLLHRSTWNDCVSAIAVEDLPSGVKVLLYRDSSYGVLLACVDANGDSSWNLSGASTNDRITSMKAVSGDC